MTPSARPENLVDEITAISRRAGEAILEIYQRDFDVSLKDDNSPLTQADLAAHRVICDALNKLTPDIPLLSEESAQLDFATRSAWHEYWLIDPLDGTKEFVNRNGEFTVNIALVREHRPVMGIVHVPVTGMTYSGLSGSGAWRQDPSAAREPIQVRRPAAEKLIVVGSRSHANPVVEQYLAQLGDYELVSMGSSLKFCLVAEGKADFYPRLGLTSEWDTAAAHAVVNAAGGHVVKLDGQPLQYNRKDSLLNPNFLVYGDPQREFADVFADYAES